MIEIKNSKKTSIEKKVQNLRDLKKIWVELMPLL
jgi:hypothetical protein